MYKQIWQHFSHLKFRAKTCIYRSSTDSDLLRRAQHGERAFGMPILVGTAAWLILSEAFINILKLIILFTIEFSRFQAA